MQEFNKINLKATVIDDDGYRLLHPKAKEILKKYPLLYTEITGVETSLITSEILKEAIEKRYNFIFEGTMKNTRILETMRKMPKEYTKIVRVMATSNIESLLTAFERNEAQIEVVGYGRFTNVLTHNKTYDGVLTSIQEVEKSGVPEVIEIFARTEDITMPKCIYSSKSNNNIYSSAYEAMKKEREINKESVKETVDKRLADILNNRNVEKFENIQRNILKEEIKKMMRGK